MSVACVSFIAFHFDLMSERKTSFVNVDRIVDRIVDRLDLSQVFSFYGHDTPEQRSGGNLRMECPVNNCEASSYGKMSVSESTPFRIKCHSCGIAGNVFTLMWVMKHHEPPEGGRLRGRQFTEIRDDLVQIAGGEFEPPSPAPRPDRVVKVKTEAVPNTPLADSDNERARATVNLHQRATTDLEKMTPGASKYFRMRPYLTLALCEKWRVAYLPKGNGTLQGRVIYPVNDEAGRRLAWTGRDPDYEVKHAKWLQDRSDKEPMKFRFPSEKYLRRGLELFGQESARLEEPGYREAIADLGLLIVEGMNDVIALDALGQPAVALMSNRMTEHQLRKVVQWARKLSAGKVTVMLDGDDKGREGAADAVYRISQQTPVQSIELTGGQQPESLSFEEWNDQRQLVIRRWRILEKTRSETATLLSDRHAGDAAAIG